jgi:hypothetical protein
VSGGQYVGGLVGYRNGGTYINNWWYSTNAYGIGSDEGHPEIVGQYQKAIAASDFYGTGSGTGGRVYYEDAGWTTPTWDFTTVWQTLQSYYPLLKWEVNIWTNGNSTGLWSDALNWSKGVVPTAVGTILFNSSSIAASTVDDGFAGSVGKLYIDGGYSGALTQETPLDVAVVYFQAAGTFNQGHDLNMAGDYIQTGGVFLDESPLSHTFTVGGSFSVPYIEGAFSRYTGTGVASDPFVIRDLYDLQAMKSHLTSHFKMDASLDAASISDWNSGTGFDPIGDETHEFTGVLRGFGKVVSNLAMNRTDRDYVGLFGHIGIGGVVSELALEKVSSYGRHYVGGLAGLNKGSLSNVYTTGSFTVSGVNFIGGLVGGNTGSIANAYSSARVTATGANVGGLAGQNNGTLDKTYAMGHVTGGSDTGGLVGSGTGTVTNSFWNEKMTGQATSVGGGTAGKVIRVTGEVDENGYAVLNADDVADPNADMMSSETYAGWDFSSGGTWVMDEGGSFPHFQYRYPEGVRGVWGVTYNTDAGSIPVADVEVGLYVNEVDPAEQRDLTKSTADGMYYFVMGQNDVEYEDEVIARIENNELTGSTREQAEDGSIMGLDIWGSLNRSVAHTYKEPPPVRIPVDQALEKAEEETNRSLQDLMNTSDQLESLQGVWGRAADVQIQDETFSVPGSEWLDKQEIEMDQPGHASISFYDNLAPGQEPMPIYTVTPVVTGTSFVEPGNVRSMMFDVAAQVLRSSDEETTPGASYGEFVPAVGGNKNTGGGTGPAEKTAPAESEPAGDGGVPAKGASPATGEQAAEKAVSAIEAASEANEAVEAGVTGSEDVSEGVASSGDDQALEEGTSGGKDAAKSREQEGGIRPDFLNPEEAKKLLTDVRVIEGAVYVIDSANEMSLLSEGESLRVSYKKQEGGGLKAGGAVQKRPAQFKGPSFILHSPFATQSAASPAKPAGAVVVKTNPPPVPAVKADTPNVRAAKIHPVRPFAKDDLPGGSVRDDASATGVDMPVMAPSGDLPATVERSEPVKVAVPQAPKEVVSVALPSVKTVAKTGTQYGTLRNPGKNVFVKCPGGQWQAARDGMVIMAGDEIRTASNNTVEVLLDGSKVGRVEVMEGSLFRIGRAETDVVTGDKTTLLDLAIGKVLVHVEKLQGKSKFEVKTPTALTGVRGTTFTVEVKEKA